MTVRQLESGKVYLIRTSVISDTWKEATFYGTVGSTAYDGISKLRFVFTDKSYIDMTWLGLDYDVKEKAE